MADFWHFCERFVRELHEFMAEMRWLVAAMSGVFMLWFGVVVADGQASYWPGAAVAQGLGFVLVGLAAWWAYKDQLS